MENSDLTFDGYVATWTMPRMEGELGGTYTGTFQFKVFLTPTQQLQAGRQFREYLGEHGKYATETEANIAFALTQLAHRIVKAPPFWTSTAQDGSPAGNIGDLNVIKAVLDAASRAEELYKEKIAKEREELLNRSIQAGEEIIKKRAEG